MFDVIAMGSSTVDLFAHTDKSKLVRLKTDNGEKEFITYPVGGKLLITQLLHNFGGNGSNAAVCFSRLGLKTAFVGKIGTDLPGLQILANLKDNKVKFLGARGNDSGQSIILDAMGEDRTILTFKGCNNELKPTEVRLKNISAKYLYLSSMLGISLETMRAVADYAKIKKIQIAFNPSQTLLETELESAIYIAKLSNILVLNKEESELMIGKNSVDYNLLALHRLGPSIVAITDGRKGAKAYADGAIYEIIPRRDITIVETTGAGDAFAATFTAAILMKKSIEQGLRMAINQSENVIQGHGAQNRLASRKKLVELAQKDIRHITKKRA